MTLIQKRVYCLITVCKVSRPVFFYTPNRAVSKPPVSSLGPPQVTRHIMEPFTLHPFLTPGSPTAAEEAEDIREGHGQVCPSLSPGEFSPQLPNPSLRSCEGWETVVRPRLQPNVLIQLCCFFLSMNGHNQIESQMIRFAGMNEFFQASYPGPVREFNYCNEKDFA